MVTVVIEQLRYMRRHLPWVFVAVALGAVLLQGSRLLQDLLVYSRTGLHDGHYFVLWTGHAVHFGWKHVIVDAGLFVILGCYLRLSWAGQLLALLLLPPFIALGMYLTEPSLAFYGGLSGVNVALLVYLCLRSWSEGQHNWVWPTILVLHAVELGFEAFTGGHGGGAIDFDRANISIATSAHVFGAVYGILWFWIRRRRPVGRP